MKALLTIWGEGKVQEELDGAVRNKTLCWDCEEDARVRLCKVKIKNLKNIYRDIKDHNGEAGSERKHVNFIKS